MHPKTSYAHEASSVLAEAAYVEELLSVHPSRTGTHGAGEPRAVARES